ncbi:hypothetical protein [Bacillus infantis]|uniref:hypothetical protein n=1 Tax=Bacillus infantis TaxID=324767 RepID=UPI003CEB6671
MTNLEKMNKLVDSNANKEQIKKWAYMNRILVESLQFEGEFEEMESSINAFMETDAYFDVHDELKLWDNFLDAEYVG